MSGRSAIEGFLGESSLITDWAWRLVKDGNVMGIVDETIRGVGLRETMEKFVLVGILCSHTLVAFRPTMEEARRYLEGDCPLPHIPSRPLPINFTELPLHHALPLPRRPSAASFRSPFPPPPINFVNAADALSDEDESEAVKLYKAQRTAMLKFSGHSAGVATDSWLQ